jgi:hypothetical protein
MVFELVERGYMYSIADHHTLIQVRARIADGDPAGRGPGLEVLSGHVERSRVSTFSKDCPSRHKTLQSFVVCRRRTSEGDCLDLNLPEYHV